MKRKPGARFDQSIPPVSDERVTTCTCTGVLSGEGVLITNTEDIDALSHLGCYGKGIFSRSVPNHNKLPQLSELRLRKKKAVQSSAYVSESVGRELMCTDPAVQEWLERLGQYERSQHTRMKLHKEWSEEKEAESKAAGTTLELQQLQADHPPQFVFQTEDHQSTVEVIATDTTTASSLPEQSTTVEKHYHCFVERIKALTCNDPYPVPEPLQLSSVEALYLASELGMLNVTQPDGTPVNCTELWDYYTSTNISTIERYIAYQYYRRKGWVPKSGLKFGVDYLLYKEGPAFYHSSYAVVVRLVDQVKLVSDSVTKPRNTGITWKEVIALNRLNESVGKELIICYVVRPQNLTYAEEGGLKLKTCVEKHSVREVFVRRWVPDKERNS